MSKKKKIESLKYADLTNEDFTKIKEETGYSDSKIIKLLLNDNFEIYTLEEFISFAISEKRISNWESAKKVDNNELHKYLNSPVEIHLPSQRIFKLTNQLTSQ